MDVIVIPILQIETETSKGGCGQGGRKNGELLLNRYRVPVWDDEKVLQIEGDDGVQQCICT